MLLSGDHARIARWRRDESLRRTAARRPDLVGRARPGRAWTRRDLEVLAERLGCRQPGRRSIGPRRPPCGRLSSLRTSRAAPLPQGGCCLTTGRANRPTPPTTVGDLWHRERRDPMQTLDALDAASLRSDIPEFRPGDTLKVHVKVVEGTRSRIQVFQGVVIRRQGDGVRETFTVRKVSFGVGVERTFPVHTPVIDKIEVVTRGDVRRAKLYYLRDLRGKAAKIKERRDTPVAR